MRKNRNEENSYPSFRPPKDNRIMFRLCPSSHFSKAGAVLLKGQRVNILALRTVPSAKTTQLRPRGSSCRQHGYTWVRLCASETLLLRRGGSWTWPVGHSLPAPILDQKKKSFLVFIHGCHDIYLDLRIWSYFPGRAFSEELLLLLLPHEV